MAAQFSIPYNFTLNDIIVCLDILKEAANSIGNPAQVVGGEHLAGWDKLFDWLLSERTVVDVDFEKLTLLRQAVAFYKTHQVNQR